MSLLASFAPGCDLINSLVIVFEVQEGQNFNFLAMEEWPSLKTAATGVFNAGCFLSCIYAAQQASIKVLMIRCQRYQLSYLFT